ncbi:hypothetical protein [Novipirellula herctigrandis]|uniref:hypothetical protein n=1 Tax=Novipirellula herctigrandis TaxID=2527986 RepID=UPI003AF401E8
MSQKSPATAHQSSQWKLNLKALLKSFNITFAFNRLETARNCTRFSEFRNIFLAKKCLQTNFFFATHIIDWMFITFEAMNLSRSKRLIALFKRAETDRSFTANQLKKMN